MAIYKTGALTGELKGAVGGVVFARAHSVLTVRTWRQPPRTRSIKQSTERLALGTFSSAWWHTLTSTQRAGWIAYALTCPFTNSIGEVFYLTGLQMFIRNNRIMAPPDVQHNDAPIYNGFPATQTATWTFNHATGQLFLASITTPPFENLLIIIAVQHFRKSTQLYPSRKLYVDTFAFASYVLPYNFATYSPTPGGVAGTVLAPLYFYIVDEPSRVSKLSKINVIST